MFMYNRQKGKTYVIFQNNPNVYNLFILEHKFNIKTLLIFPGKSV